MVSFFFSLLIFLSLASVHDIYIFFKNLFIIAAEGAENDLEFTIVRPFNWIGPRMDFIPGIDGPSEGVPRVLACFSNVGLLLLLLIFCHILCLFYHSIYVHQFLGSLEERTT